MIVVVDYDESWPLQFESLRDQYRSVLGGVAVVGIERVGSTSLPGRAAKPIIDVEIVVADADVRRPEQLLKVCATSPSARWGYRNDGRSERPRGGIRTNSYVTVEGCLSLRNHLAARNLLRNHETLRAEYGTRKKQLG
jgi:GrpB-like predicted nucleotidyltransferase (UPF0157 family)